MPHRALPPSIALAAYAESLVEGRRVLVFGNASSGFADDLVERGARLVHVYDEDSDRAAEARARSDGRSILYAPLTEAGLALRQAAFDIGIIENLAAAHDAAARIRELKHALTPRGAALIATPNPDVKLRLLAESEPRVVSFDYYALFDLVSSEFSLVRMLGQAPFVGYAVVDFAPDGEPEPSFDNGFVPGGSEEPEWFVALASSHRVRLEEFGVIQLSLRQTLASLSERSGLDRRPRAVETEIAGLRSELARREQAMANLEQRVASAEAHADSLQDEMDGLRGDLVRAERASILPPSPTEAPSAPSEPSAPVSLAKPATVQEPAERSPLDLANEALAREVEALQAELAERKRALDALSALGEVADASHGEEIGALEVQLAARGTEIRRLTDALREAERFGKELVREVAALRVRATPPEPRRADLGDALDGIAVAHARSAADLEAAHWTIAQLKVELGALGGSPPDTNR